MTKINVKFYLCIFVIRFDTYKCSICIILCYEKYIDLNRNEHLDKCRPRTFISIRQGICGFRGYKNPSMSRAYLEDARLRTKHYVCAVCFACDTKSREKIHRDTVDSEGVTRSSLSGGGGEGGRGRKRLTPRRKFARKRDTRRGRAR